MVYFTSTIARKHDREEEAAQGKMGLCIGYVRVSSDKQHESLDAQAEKIRAMATVQSVHVAELIVDAAESAKSLHRPGMQKLLSLVNAKKVDRVIIAKLDRITRSVKDLADLMDLFNRHGVSLVSVAESLDTTSPSGRLVANIMISVSQWEREAIASRTRDVMQHKRSKGERVGTIPYGCQLSTDGKRLEPNATETQVLARIREMKASGFSLREISRELNESGFKTRRGSAWHHVYVGAMLKPTRVVKSAAA